MPTGLRATAGVRPRLTWDAQPPSCGHRPTIFVVSLVNLNHPFTKGVHWLSDPPAVTEDSVGGVNQRHLWTERALAHAWEWVGVKPPVEHGVWAVLGGLRLAGVPTRRLVEAQLVAVTVSDASVVGQELGEHLAVDAGVEDALDDDVQPDVEGVPS